MHVCARSQLDSRRELKTYRHPALPLQAKGLLLASIRNPNTVNFMGPKIFYCSAIEQVPIDDLELHQGAQRSSSLAPT